MKKNILLIMCGALLATTAAKAESGYDPDRQPDLMQYFTPVGGKYFVGDCIPFFYDGTYYLYWLLDGLPTGIENVNANSQLPTTCKGESFQVSILSPQP